MLQSKISRRLAASFIIVATLPLAIIGWWLLEHIHSESMAYETSALVESARLTQTLLLTESSAIWTAGADNNDYTELARTIDRISAVTSLRLTIIRSDGTVIADTSEKSGQLDNHLQRPEIQAALNAGPHGYGQAIRYSDSLKTDYLYVAMPIYATDGSLLGVIRTSKSLAAANSSYQTVAHSIAFVICLSLLLALVLSFYLTNRQLRPIIALSRAAADITGGNLNRRIHLSSHDEFDHLAHTLNMLTANLASRIQQSEAESRRLQLVLQSTDDAIMLLSESGSITDMNDRARSYFNLGQEDLQRHSIHVLGNAQLSEAARDVAATNQPRTITLRLMASDARTETATTAGGHPAQTERAFEIYLAPFPCNTKLETWFSTDEPTVLAVFHDITIEQELVNRQADFVANAAHELATPLTSISGFAELLASDDYTDPESDRHYASVIAKEASRMTRLVHQLLQLARLDSNDCRAHFPQRPVDAAQTLHAAVAGLRRVAADKKQSLELDLPSLPAGGAISESDTTAASGQSVPNPSSPPLCLQANPDLLEELLRNLLENASKYTPEGGRITASCGLSDDGQSIIYTIADNGVGIDTADLPRIFERFYRADKARARKTGGNGLGLSLVKFLVELFGGKITVQSSTALDAHGTTFTLTFPRLGQSTSSET